MNGNCDHSVLEELRAGNPAAYELLYQRCYPVVAHYIGQNQGSPADAADIFQEAVLVLHRQVAEPGFQLRHALKTYLYAVARRLWLKQLRDEKLRPVDDEQLAALHDEHAWEDARADEQPSAEQVHAWLARITGHCQQVLTSLYFLDSPMEDLMQTMGWKNRHTANNQKYKCIQQIRKAAGPDRDPQ